MNGAVAHGGKRRWPWPAIRLYRRPAPFRVERSGRLGRFCDRVSIFTDFETEFCKIRLNFENARKPLS